MKKVHKKCVGNPHLLPINLRKKIKIKIMNTTIIVLSQHQDSFIFGRRMFLVVSNIP